MAAPDGGAQIAPELEAGLIVEPDLSPMEELTEPFEERLAAEANASYGDELYHGRRMGGLSTMKFEGDGSVRGLRNAAVSLGYVVPLEATDSPAEPEPGGTLGSDWGNAVRGASEVFHLDPAAEQYFGPGGVAQPLFARPVPVAPDPNPEERDAADPQDPGEALGGTDEPSEPAWTEAQGSTAYPVGAIAVETSAAGAPQFYTTMLESNLVTGPATAPSLAEIALFLEDEDPETFEFVAPEEVTQAEGEVTDPAEDTAMVELLIAEVMREIYDESEGFTFGHEPADVDEVAHGGIDHIGHHSDFG